MINLRFFKVLYIVFCYETKLISGYLENSICSFFSNINYCNYLLFDTIKNRDLLNIWEYSKIADIEHHWRCSILYYRYRLAMFNKLILYIDVYMQEECVLVDGLRYFQYTLNYSKIFYYYSFTLLINFFYFLLVNGCDTQIGDQSNATLIYIWYMSCTSILI